MGSLMIMVGIPGSGKSTQAKGMIGYLDNEIYVSRDEIRFNLLNDEDDYFAKEDEVWEKFVDTIIEGLKNNKRVWVDATHINRSSRYKILAAIHQQVTPEKIEILFMDTPLEVCLTRNENRRGGRAYVPPKVIANMHRKLQLPRYNEFKQWNYDSIWVKEEGLVIRKEEK